MWSRVVWGAVLGVVVWVWLRVGLMVWECATLRHTHDTLVKTPNNSSGSKRVCYYLIPRHDNHVANLTPPDLDPHLCTHVIIGGATIVNASIVPLDESDAQVYAGVVALKQVNPALRVMLCLGSGFPDLVRDPQAVAVFAYNAQQFLLKHGLDGLDLDWEFPAWPYWRADPKEKTWFTFLVTQLNNALKLASHPGLLLSVAVGAPRDIVDTSYQVEQLARLVDWVSIMGYDYHMYQSYLPFTGLNAPLRPRHDQRGYWATLNIQWATRYWLAQGAPRDKLVVGIPTYGRSWRLVDPAWHGIGSPAAGVGMYNGSVTHTQACVFVTQGATQEWDQESGAPFAHRGTDWLSYEDEESIREKVTWIRSQGVAGVMTFDLNSDDWPGMCSGNKYPLHNVVKEVMTA